MTMGAGDLTMRTMRRVAMALGLLALGFSTR